jgi:hypothetical protein
VNGPKISFTPSFSDIEASIVEVYTMMKNAVYDLQRMDSQLLEEEVSGKAKNLKPVLLPEILDTAKVEISLLSQYYTVQYCIQHIEIRLLVEKGTI